MPAPTNTNITTALYLGNTLPISHTQQQDFGGVTYPCWYSFDVPAGLNEISARAYGDFSTWVPGVTIWRGPTNAPELVTGGGGSDVWNQAPCTPGERLYIKSQKRSIDVVPAVTTIEAVAGGTQVAEYGDIIHPDSSFPYPAVIMNSQFGTIKGFNTSFSQIETSGVLASGRAAVYDFNDQVVKILDTALNVIATPTLPVNLTGYVIGTDGLTGWWAIKRGLGATHCFAYFIDPTGAVTRGPFDMGASSAGLKTVAPNPAGTSLYWTKTSQQGHPGDPIYQIDLGTLVITNFLAGTADDLSFWLPYILVLTDGSVVLSFQTTDVAPNRYVLSSVVRRYSAAAVLLEEWDLFPELAAPAWLFSATDNPASFWVWGVGIQTTLSPVTQPWNKYWHLTSSNTSLPAPILKYQFIEGVSQQPGELNADRFGTDFGGAPWISRLSPVPGCVAELDTGSDSTSSGCVPTI